MYVLGSVKALFRAFLSIPVLPSPRLSSLSLVRASTRSSSVMYLELWGRAGRQKKTTMESRTEGQPSMRKRIRHWGMAEDLMEETGEAGRGWGKGGSQPLYT